MLSPRRARYQDSSLSRGRRRAYGREPGFDDSRRSTRYPNQGASDYCTLSNAPPSYGAQMGGYEPPGTRSPSSGYGPPTQYSDYDLPPRPRTQYDRNLQYSDNAYVRPRGDQIVLSSYSPSYSSRRENGGFRPLALPQVTYGEGKPFLRGYSNELMQYGISEAEFIPVVDSLNKAIIPNPENQIFQKAAKIAGHFVPGADGIGIIAGEIAIGIGSAIGHGAMLGKRLSDSNLRIFIPKGLEICLGKGQNVDQEAGFSAVSQGYQGAVDPQSRLAQYGDFLMPLSVVYPEQQKIGRQDPIALIGKGMSAKDAQRNMQRAGKERDRGRRTKKGDSLEGGLQWLIVRKASPNSIAQWQQTLQKSEAALAQEQAKANP